MQRSPPGREHQRKLLGYSRGVLCRLFFPNPAGAPQYAARVQALLQLLVSVGLPPTVSQRNKAMLTEASSVAVSVYRNQMIQGAVAKPSYGAQESCAPSEYQAVIDSAAGPLAYAIIPNVKDPKESKSRSRISRYRRTVLSGPTVKVRSTRTIRRKSMIAKVARRAGGRVETVGARMV